MMNLLLPFQPKKWNLRAAAMAVKFALGATILVICSVYWVQYRGFAIDDSGEAADDHPSDPVTITLDEAPNVYSGWNLLSYIFATTPTLEGTLKKGSFRILATACGAFAAWLAIIVCSGSYDATAPVNVYGLTAWLTITTGIASYFGVPSGPAAFMGLDPATSSFTLYFIMTQSLCALEIALGIGERDVIVANRVVATVTGVLMSMLIAVIPPRRRGGKIEPFVGLLRLIEGTLKEGLHIMLENNEKDDSDTAKGRLNELRDAFISQSHQDKADVEFLLKDASKHNALPFLKVDRDGRLSRSLETMTLLAADVCSWIEFAIHVAEDEDVKLSDKENAVFREGVEQLLQQLSHLAHTGTDADTEHAKGLDVKGAVGDMTNVGSRRKELGLLLGSALFICKKLEKEEIFFASLSS